MRGIHKSPGILTAPPSGDRIHHLRSLRIRSERRSSVHLANLSPSQRSLLAIHLWLHGAVLPCFERIGEQEATRFLSILLLGEIQYFLQLQIAYGFGFASTEINDVMGNFANAVPAIHRDLFSPVLFLRLF